MKVITLITLLLLTNNYSFGQRSLTKEEILKYWNMPCDKDTNDSNVVVNAGSTLNVQMNKILDSLRANEVDSIIIFSTALPGYVSISKCDTGITPITSFVIWRKDNSTLIKKIRGNCSSITCRDSSAYIFEFYDKNQQKIETEFFMPVILGGQMHKDKTISYLERWIDHEPNYSFYYEVGKHHKYFQFSKSYLDDSESLFHDYNLSLSTYHWWRLIKQEIDKID